MEYADIKKQDGASMFEKSERIFFGYASWFYETGKKLAKEKKEGYETNLILCKLGELFASMASTLENIGDAVGDEWFVKRHGRRPNQRDEDLEGSIYVPETYDPNVARGDIEVDEGKK